MRTLILTICALIIIGSLAGGVSADDRRQFLPDEEFILEKFIFIRLYILPLHDWGNLAELRQFLKEDNTDSCVYARANEQGVIVFDSCCVDQAEHLRDEAAKIGRNLEVIPVTPKEYRRIFGASKDEYHAVCMARIGDYFYAVEPDNDMVKRAYKIP